MKQWELNEIMKRYANIGNFEWKIGDKYGDQCDIDGYVDGKCFYSVAQDVEYDDATFIVNALQDIPKLVARIKELDGLGD